MDFSDELVTTNDRTDGTKVCKPLMDLVLNNLEAFAWGKSEKKV